MGRSGSTPSVSKKPIFLSQGEQRLLDIVQEFHSPVSTKELVPIFYEGREIPENAQVAMTGLTRSLARKEQRFKRSARSGPHPIKVWLE